MTSDPASSRAPSERLSASGTATYAIDPAHSTCAFRISFLGLGHLSGQFQIVSGRIRFDPEDLRTVEAEVEIDAGSIDTGNADRDGDLRSAEFLNAAAHPRITFVSTEAGSVDVNAFKLAGDLTLRGVTRQVVLEVTYLGMSRDAEGRERALFDASTTIDRAEFGLRLNHLLEVGKLLIGNDIRFLIELRAVREPA